MKMDYCPVCGTKLIERDLEGEGKTKYCETCGDYRFPLFSTAVSMVVLDPAKEKILLIKQYHRDRYILVAGYVNKGEDAEDAVRREIQEETGLEVAECHFNRSHYFAPSETLMLNYTTVVKDTELHPNREIDSYAWFSKEEAREHIFHGSLAEIFLNGYLDGTYPFDQKEDV